MSEKEKTIIFYEKLSKQTAKNGDIDQFIAIEKILMRIKKYG